MRYVSVLYLTLTSFRFRDERRQRGARVTRTPSAVEEPPSRSRALFHPSSSFHYLILLAFSCHSYPLISTHIPFDPHSTSILVPPSLSSGASRCSRGFTPHRSLVMLATALLHQDLSFYPSMVCWAPRPSHTHYMVPFAPLGRCPCSVKPRPCVIPDVTCIILVHTTNTADKITTPPFDQQRRRSYGCGGRRGLRSNRRLLVTGVSL